MADRSPASEPVPASASASASDEPDTEFAGQLDTESDDTESAGELDAESDAESDDTESDDTESDDTELELAAVPAQDRSLTNRWWWQGAVLVLTGIAVIGWQWNIVSTDKAIPATWVMIVIGACVIVFGGIVAWRDRPQRPGSPEAV
jgi:uncharacterized membrane protein YcjF (UPF0283 family)